MRSVPTYLSVALSLLFSLQGSTQPANDPCSNAAELCPGTPIAGNNIGATVDTCAGCEDDPSSWGACFTPHNSVWYSFMTNDNGGDANVSIDLSNCLSGATKGDALQAVVLEAGTACDGSTYSDVSNCVQNGTGSFGLNANGLAPNTRYWILVDGATNGNASSPAECDFSISVDGPAVRFITDTTIVHKDCQGADGEIQLSNVSGGTSPYEFSLNGGAYQGSGSFTGLDGGQHNITIRDANGCEQEIGPITIQELNGPSVDTVLIDSSACAAADGSLELDGVTGGSQPYDFELNGNVSQTDSLFDNLGAGVYDVIVTDQSGCTDTVNDIMVPNSDGIHFAQETVSISACGMDNGEATVDSTSGGTAPYSYQWNDPGSQTGPTATGLAPGQYEVSITDDNGCEFTIHNIVVPEEPPDTAELSLLVDQNPACQGEDVSFNADLVNGGSNPTFDWYVNGSNVQSGANSSYTSSSLSDGDEVQVEVATNDPCIHPDTLASNIITLSMEAPVNTNLDMSVNQSSICDGENVIIMLNATDAGPSPLFRCSSNGTEFYTGTEDTIAHSSFSDGDLLSCEVIPDHPCGDTVSAGPIPIDVTPFDPSVTPASSTILKGGSIGLVASGGDSYSWSPASSLSSASGATTTASPEQTTTYDVEVQKGDCDSILHAIVNVETPIRPPNTITPNGDGKNDVWRIAGIGRFPDAEVTVYDRWGQQVFHSVGYGQNDRWDGSSGGQKVPAGTYYYVIELNYEEFEGDEEDTMFTGSLTILY